MAELTADEVNKLIYGYLRSEGLELTARALLHETNTSTEEPDLDLVKLLLKGLESVKTEQAITSSTQLLSIDFGLQQLNSLPGGRLVKICGDNVVICGQELVCAETSALDKVKKLPYARINDVAFMGRNQVFVSQSNGPILVLDLSTDPITLFPPTTHTANMIKMVPFTDRLLAINGKHFCVFNAQGDVLCKETQLENAEASDISYAEWVDQDTVALAINNKVHIYKYSEGIHKVIEQHLLPVSYLTVSAGGSVVYSGSEEGLICAIDSTGQQQRPFKAHAGVITFLGTYANLLVSASNDGKVKVWCDASLLFEFDVEAPIYTCTLNGSSLVVVSDRVQVVQLKESGAYLIASLTLPDSRFNVAAVGNKVFLTNESETRVFKIIQSGN